MAANTVQNKLGALGYSTVLEPVKSDGDLVLDKPLYELGTRCFNQNPRHRLN